MFITIKYNQQLYSSSQHEGAVTTGRVATLKRPASRSLSTGKYAGKGFTPGSLSQVTECAVPSRNGAKRLKWPITEPRVDLALSQSKGSSFAERWRRATLSQKCAGDETLSQSPVRTLILRFLARLYIDRAYFRQVRPPTALQYGHFMLEVNTSHIHES